MKTTNTNFKITLSAMFLALAFVMPFLTGQIPQIGSMMCPMHIPVILCGYICGAPWGLIVGFVSPLLRSFILGMPTLFPKAVAMAFELGTYGFISGLLYKRLPKKKINIYLTLIVSMVSGRLVWGLVQLLCVGLDTTKFNLSVFWTGAVANAVPGITIQLILIPIIIALLKKTKLFKEIFQ